MKIVVTGATGFVGSQLVPLLTEDAELLLVSRDADAVRRLFPSHETCDYETLRTRDLKGVVFIHLAARNNDRPGTWEEFRAANLDGLIDLASIARETGATRFINLCSTHALEPDGEDFYGLSKREGARALAAMWPEGAVNLYVPAIHGDRFRGRLTILGCLPSAIRPLALALLRQLKPTLSVERLHATLREISSMPIVSTDPYRSERYAADPVPDIGLFAASKRVLDLLAAFAIIVLVGWAMVLIALYIRFDSKGPAVFAQPRVGRGGRAFICYKFRTMALGTAHAATHQVSAAAVTKAGRFLRRTKLDELPQVVNLLLNNMSLVGPRPCLPVQSELIASRQARGVLHLKPGITGLAQIRDIDMSDPARLAAWDDRYRAFRTLAADIVILVRTVLGGGSGDRVAPR